MKNAQGRRDDAAMTVYHRLPRKLVEALDAVRDELRDELGVVSLSRSDAIALLLRSGLEGYRQGVRFGLPPRNP